MPDPTDNYGFVPHRLEELHNVDTTMPSVGDVLTVSAVTDGVPTWEATAPNTTAWERIVLPTAQGDWLDNSGGPPVTLSGTTLPLQAGDNVSGLPTGDGIGVVAAARRHEARFTLRTRRDAENDENDSSYAYMRLQSGNYSRSIKWRWLAYDGGHQIEVGDQWGILSWASVADPTDWQTVVITIRIPDFGVGYTAMVDGEYASVLSSDPVDNDAVYVTFSVDGGGPPLSYIDVSNTFIDVRTI